MARSDVKNDHKRPPGSKKPVGGVAFQRPKRRALMGDADEEIDSEEEEEAQQRGKEAETSAARPAVEGEDEDFFETTEEKRVKLAKKYLERVGLGTKTDAEIAEKLTLEADITGKRVHYEVADKVSSRYGSKWPLASWLSVSRTSSSISSGPQRCCDLCSGL